MNQLKRICNCGNPKPNMRRIKPIRLSELLAFCFVCMITSQCWPGYQPLFHCSPSTCCKKVSACVFFWRSSSLFPLVCLLFVVIVIVLSLSLSLSLAVLVIFICKSTSEQFRLLRFFWMLISHKWLSHW
jgi:hypothetical protein